MTRSIGLISSERLADAQLLLSEVVTNAVRYGAMTDASVRITVHADEDRMVVEVQDSGLGFDPDSLCPPVADALDGWGLDLVAQLADR
jgi:anti-sigma regulatory factor (Ser/Thr protein kinase)